MNRWIAGQKPYFPTKGEQRSVIAASRKLLEVDAEDFAAGVYPQSVYLPENLTTHFPRLLRLLTDSAKSSFRRRRKQIKQFSNQADSRENLPEYYTRNFHFQTDGYLSDHSADLYEHQVELLFRGMADPMRRRLLKPMVSHLFMKKNLKILELGCGSGSFTKTLSQTFPDAHITAVDLSPSYIRKAKRRFLNQKNVHFLTGDAQFLPFKANQFDAVVSVFMHHELPKAVRSEVIRESVRVVKPDGFWGLLDSLQLEDTPELNWALREFPKSFHEPFFKNYVNTPLQQMVMGVVDEFTQVNEEHFFFSKIVYHQGSSEPSQE
jgi:ubiquinone/menaquinone biosynthesis C-methylase UbiE